MKAILLLVGFCTIALALPSTTKWIPKKYKVEEKVFLERQLNILRLFKTVNQPLHYPEFVTMAQTFHPENHLDSFGKHHYVEDFFNFYNHDILPQGSIFSIFYHEHLEQVVPLFKMFYYAKDWDTFFKTVVWARQHVNEGMWLYAFTVALVHRPDTYGFIIPPIYEIYPYYFFNNEIIYKAQYYKQIYHHGDYPKDEHDYHGYTITGNYTGWYLNVEPEQYLSYFTEDVGLNAFYYYYHIYYPFWMDGEEFSLNNDRRGELFYAIHQTLWARYYSERLSHDFHPLPLLRHGSVIEPSYYSTLTYPNGLPFPSRPAHTPLNWDTGYGRTYLNFTGAYYTTADFTRRMRDALDLGFVYTHSGQKVSLRDEKGIEIFADLLEGNPDSPNIDYYGMINLYMRHLLGYAPTPLHEHYFSPSVLEHYETALRDPAYWYFVKWIIYYFQEFKHHQIHSYYTESEISFPGVKIESVQVDRLTTYFEWYYSDLSNAVYYNYKYETEPFNVRVRQQRLSHKPFTYTVNVNSDKAVDSIFRVYLGPKYDAYDREIPFVENRLHFYLIDKFFHHLLPGKNTIVRNSKQTFTVSDKTSYWHLYKKVMGALKGSEGLIIDGSETFWGLPNRLLLPIGKHGGMPFQLYVQVMELKHETGERVLEEQSYPKVGSGGFYIDKLPFYFPLDKPIHLSASHWPSNHYFTEVHIYHKNITELNVSTQE